MFTVLVTLVCLFYLLAGWTIVCLMVESTTDKAGNFLKFVCVFIWPVIAVQIIYWHYKDQEII